MSLWTQITGGKDSKTTKRLPRKARPRLETMESRTMLSAVATFRLIDGDLYEKQGRRQSLVATNVVSLGNLNRRTIEFVERNGNVFEKTAKGPAELIQRGNPTPTPPPSPPPAPAGFSPEQIKVAYSENFQFLVNGQRYEANGAGQTIAIVEAGYDPAISQDLAAFDQEFGLPAPPNFSYFIANGAASYFSGAGPPPRRAGTRRPHWTWNGPTRSRLGQTYSWRVRQASHRQTWPPP